MYTAVRGIKTLASIGTNRLDPWLVFEAVCMCRNVYVIIPTTRLVTVGDRAFTAAGSRLWNSLPPDIRSAQTLPVFCNRLKTYLFSKCFPT